MSAPGHLQNLLGTSSGKINDPENWLEVLAFDDPDQAFTNFTNSLQAFISWVIMHSGEKAGQKAGIQKALDDT